jgi:hypothetical protein
MTRRKTIYFRKLSAHDLMDPLGGQREVPLKGSYVFEREQGPAHTPISKIRNLKLPVQRSPGQKVLLVNVRKANTKELSYYTKSDYRKDNTIRGY